MKILISFLLIAFASCTSIKPEAVPVPAPVTETSKPKIEKTPAPEKIESVSIKSVVDSFHFGTVSLEKDLCGISIKISGKTMQDFYPVSLDEKYRIQGLMLKFKVTPSKVKSPEGCTKTPMIMSEVTALEER